MNLNTADLDIVFYHGSTHNIFILTMPKFFFKF